MLLNADWHWLSRKVSRVNPEPFHSRKQRGSFQPQAGGSAVCATHLSFGLFQDLLGLHKSAKPPSTSEP
jgi:hypothetical protein